MSPEDVLEAARQGARLNCGEALFTLGDRPEARYGVASKALEGLGHPTTTSYLIEMATRVHKETGLLAHINAGILTRDEITALRKVSVSQGIMLESTSERLAQKGGPHFGCFSKLPETRIEMIEAAGEAAVPFTTGILIGIGETRAERIDALLTIQNLHSRFHHIQEVIVQNFLPKPETGMANASALPFEEFLWSVAAARLILDPAIHLQAPPNLSFERFPSLLEAGIDDWGGVSPVTPDFVNPEAPWPALDQLRDATRQAGFTLVPRLPIYPEFLADAKRWVDRSVLPGVIAASDSQGWARFDSWSPGVADAKITGFPRVKTSAGSDLTPIIQRAFGGSRITASDIERLFQARDEDVGEIVAAADQLRQQASGGTVRYVVNRNINYTNICELKCSFCAFSKGKTAEHLRGKPYNLSLEEVARRAEEAWERGATEVCMQGGIHPNFDGSTYLALLNAVKSRVPKIHVHAFSPLEVWHGATNLELSIETFLGMLRDSGLGSLPGTAAEILDDEVRARLCPDKLTTRQWLDVVSTAHRIGLRTTATIMFGHMEAPRHWARHLLAIRDLQEAHGGFTEFVPLPFVHMEAPAYFKGYARKGPTSRETILMHAVSRLVLHPLIQNIQTSWVKLGSLGVLSALHAGANDLGGTLMNESISRAAGTEHGQEMPPDEMDRLITSAGRTPEQRTTLYNSVPKEQVEKSYQAAELAPLSFGIAPVAYRAGVSTAHRGI
jgi:FO synthase